MITQTALELGFLYALVAMALFLSFRILNIADMTTDGCFVLGAAVSVTLAAGGHPILAIPAAMLAGSCAGFVTAFLQTRLGIPSILAGIVTNTGLYTVNLMAMGWKANQSLLGGSTIFTLLRDSGIGSDWYELLLAASVTMAMSSACGSNKDPSSSAAPSACESTVSVSMLWPLLWLKRTGNRRG